MTTPQQFCATLLALVGVFLVPSLAQAQSYAVDKGSVLIGGDVNITGSGLFGPDAARIWQVQFNPNAQYFVAPGLAVGGNLRLNYVSNSEYYRSSSYGVGPTVSYYFGQSERKLYPYMSAGIGLIRLTTRSVASIGGDSMETKSTTLGADMSGGLLFMLTRGVGLSGELFYNAQNFSGKIDGVDQNTFGFRIGISAFVF